MTAVDVMSSIPLVHVLQLMGYRQRWKNPPLVCDGEPNVEVWNPECVGKEDSTVPGVKRTAVAILGGGDEAHAVAGTVSDVGDESEQGACSGVRQICCGILARR